MLTEQLICAARFQAPLEALEMAQVSNEQAAEKYGDVFRPDRTEKLKFSTNLCLCMQSSRCLKKPMCSCCVVLEKQQRPQRFQSKGCTWVMWQFLIAVIKHHSQKQLVNVHLVAVLDTRTHNVRENPGAGSQNRKLNDHLSSHKEKKENLEWVGL